MRMEVQRCKSRTLTASKSKEGLIPGSTPDLPDAWITALQFLGVVDGVIPSTPLSSINHCFHPPRVDRIVAVIKSCTPNGFGGLMVTLEDPTGMLDATIHHKVLTQTELGKDLLVGSLLILQKVAVFAPTRTSCYLNITLKNLVKVFKMDMDLKWDRDPPMKQVNASYKFVAPEKVDCGGETSRLNVMSFSELGTNKEIQEDARSCTSMRQNQNGSQREKENQRPQSSSCQNEVSINQSLAKRKFSSSGQDATSAVFEELPAEENVDCGTTDASNTGAETQRASGVQNLTQSVHATTSPPLFTDEQLDLLFADGTTDAINIVAETQRASGVQNPTQSVHARTCLPLFTDEQLDLLFADGTTDASNIVAEKRASGAQNPTQPVLARTSLPLYTDEQLDLLFSSGEDDDFVY